MDKWHQCMVNRRIDTYGHVIGGAFNVLPWKTPWDTLGLESRERGKINEEIRVYM